MKTCKWERDAEISAYGCCSIEKRRKVVQAGYAFVILTFGLSGNLRQSGQIAAHELFGNVIVKRNSPICRWRIVIDGCPGQGVHDIAAADDDNVVIQTL